MKTTEAIEKLSKINQQSDEEDAMFACFFSKEDDKFEGFQSGMDAGDALILIDNLIEMFGLSRAAIAGEGAQIAAPFV